MAVRQTIASANNRAPRLRRRRLLMGHGLDNSTGAGHPVKLLHSESAESPERRFTETAVAASTRSRTAVVIQKRSRRALRFESSAPPGSRREPAVASASTSRAMAKSNQGSARNWSPHRSGSFRSRGAPRRQIDGHAMPHTSSAVTGSTVAVKIPAVAGEAGFPTPTHSPL
jgi:hypothetical protein